jgi:hypothetical protein
MSTKRGIDANEGRRPLRNAGTYFANELGDGRVALLTDFTEKADQ